MTPDELRAAYKLILNSKDGERVLEDLEARYHVNGSTFSVDPCETAYREGQRTVVLFMKSMLKDQPKREDIVET
jgi:bifunctional pyridoxal-dependent enzyme with beta-cystathionase and maltose regulon repressor activities